MIRSFRKRNAAAELFEGRFVRGIDHAVQKRAHVKLLVLHYAVRLDDLRIPAGNHLEALRGNRKGQYSLRVNGQWRICFTWNGRDAEEVEFVDYH